jgi:NAD(P)-dependent dehydrogenase (short-subunit alcohol dehydrogenase family)
MSTNTVLDRFRLDGKVAIATGAYSGLGVAFGNALAEADADIDARDTEPAVGRGLTLAGVVAMLRRADRDVPRSVAQFPRRVGP